MVGGSHQLHGNRCHTDDDRNPTDRLDDEYDNFDDEYDNFDDEYDNFDEKNDNFATTKMISRARSRVRRGHQQMASVSVSTTEVSNGHFMGNWNYWNFEVALLAQGSCHTLDFAYDNSFDFICHKWKAENLSS